MVLIADTPNVRTGGDWRVGVCARRGASEQQFEKLFCYERWAIALTV